MSYQPLSEVRKTLKVKWYRSPLDPETRRMLNERSDAQGWIQSGGQLLIFILLGALVYYFWAQQMWLGFAIALFLHGTLASFFEGIAPHELAHGTVFKTKRLNRIFLHIYSFISWWDFYDYDTSHNYHHRYTLYPEGDRENLLPIEPALRLPILIQLFTINLFSMPGRTFSKGGLLSTIWVTILGAFGRVGSTDIPYNEWRQTLHEDKPEEHQKSVSWSRILLLGHGVLIVISIITGQWVLPFIISFSTFIGNWAVYFLGTTQHSGLQENVPDFRKNSRSIILNPIFEYLYWHMNWHIEHHMYVSIPCYNLRKLSEAIADDMPELRTLRQAWKEMRETWKKQQTDPDYYFDTPIPSIDNVR